MISSNSALPLKLEGESLKRKTTEDNAKVGHLLGVVRVEVYDAAHLEVRERGPAVTSPSGAATVQVAGTSHTGIRAGEVAVATGTATGQGVGTNHTGIKASEVVVATGTATSEGVGTSYTGIRAGEVAATTGTATNQGVGTSHTGIKAGEVAATEDWETHPFWLLLKRAGYEKW